MKNIIITGAYGFLGAALVNHFVDLPFYQITILVKSNSRNFRIATHHLEKINIIYVDKPDFIIKISNVNRPIIIHAANDYGKKNNLSQLLSNNLLFPLRILEIDNSELFINFDTYFNKGKSNYSYLSSYILSKKLLETSLESFSKKKIINLKIEHLYGPNDGENKFTYQLINALKTQKTFNTTNGLQKRDFLYVDDLVNLISEIVNKHHLFKKAYYNFEIGNGYSVRIKDFIQTAKVIFQSETSINFGALPIRENEIMDSFANLDLLPDFLKWHPRINIKKGLSFIKELGNEK